MDLLYNGSPFGVPTRDVIPPMSLWLKAWGIMPILNRPKMPTDNPNVENNQHTSARWAEVYKCQNIKQMEQQLDEAAAIQRDHFKVSRLGYATRKQVFDSQDPRFSKENLYNLLLCQRT